MPKNCAVSLEVSNGGYAKPFSKTLLIFGGEALPGSIIKEIFDSGADCSIVNHYGPTETTIGKLIYQVDKRTNYSTTVPIGTPFSNTSIYVLNKNLNYCQTGVPGELYIGGDGLARGYLNLAELTSKSFIANPYKDPEAPFLYKTGDLVQWLPTGDIQYLGRIDDQVKIRGNRIELGEIQNILQKHTEVKQCAVLVDQNNDGEPKLVAYVVTEGDLKRDELINFMRGQLPDYMVPRIIVKIKDFPFLPNGKINKKLLPKPELSSLNQNKKLTPITKEEQFLAAIWAESLGLKEISTTDDFFELGGHSLIAVKVMSMIEKEMGVRLPLSSLFDHSTIQKLAGLIAGKTEHKQIWDSLVPIKSTGSKKPIYIIHGGGLNILVFKSMSQYMDPEQPVYALQALGLNGKTTLYNSVEEIAAKYNSEILQVDSRGPYLLAGYSLGGKIAFEMAKQLLASGRQVKMLGIFDTFIPIVNQGRKKLTQKIGRQFRKVPYICKQFINNPAETFFYQWLVMKRKFLILTDMYKEPETEVFSYNDEILRRYEDAYKTYKMTPIGVNIDLFRVKKRIYYLDDMVHLGWKPYGTIGIDVHEIPGDHKTFLFPPNDKELAVILQRVIDGKNLQV